MRLFFQIVRPRSEPVAHIALLHGYAEHLGRHSEVTRALVAARYAVHLLDVRGHGQSGGKRAHVDRFEDYLADLEVSLPMRNELKPEQLTRDVAIQEATRKDPLYQQIATPRWFNESSRAQETVLRRATEFVTPLLLLCGGADPIADPKAAREFFDHATSQDKQFKQYDGLLHEIFHEPERDVVFRDLIGWLDERAGGSVQRAATGQR
ncbi:MAG: lysophospholipase [Deltaproteobacteria bacterium]|nr:MAG: lysophospholipase [Deltaproteobacteria bacterium]